VSAHENSDIYILANYNSTKPFPIDPDEPDEPHQLTWRALIVGCFLGAIGSFYYTPRKYGCEFYFYSHVSHQFCVSTIRPVPSI
jgi:hypothetical protein